MAHPWPEPVERVSAFLREAAAEARVEEFLAGSATAQEAAVAIGCDLDRIVKSLLFECDSRPVLVLVPGDRRADKAKVAAAAGATRASVASPQWVTEMTGFEPGAVAPFPLARVEHVFLDRALLVHDRVWIGAGSPRHMVGLAPSELVRLARATPFDVTSED
jgi:prolyl-tRNA editing enzyme YbaK/EbsC (Cys-tRNA(Pro) deacylase)